jgi:hypothetical protein
MGALRKNQAKKQRQPAALRFRKDGAKQGLA